LCAKKKDKILSLVALNASRTGFSFTEGSGNTGASSIAGSPCSFYFDDYGANLETRNLSNKEFVRRYCDWEFTKKGKKYCRVSSNPLIGF
jgi:hypothetical protein